MKMTALHGSIADFWVLAEFRYNYDISAQDIGFINWFSPKIPKLMSYYTGRFPRRGAAAAAEGWAVLGVRLHHRVLHAQGRVRAARHAHPHKAPGEQATLTPWDSTGWGIWYVVFEGVCRKEMTSPIMKKYLASQYNVYWFQKCDFNPNPEIRNIFLEIGKFTVLFLQHRIWMKITFFELGDIIWWC